MAGGWAWLASHRQYTITTGQATLISNVCDIISSEPVVVSNKWFLSNNEPLHIYILAVCLNVISCQVTQFICITENTKK